MERKGVITLGKGKDGRQSRKREAGTKEKDGREARQVALCVAWVLAFSALQNVNTHLEFIYAAQLVLTGTFAAASMSCGRACCAGFAGCIGLMVSIAMIHLWGDLQISDMNISVAIAIVAAIRVFSSVSASGWLVAMICNIYMTTYGWTDIPVELAACLVWGGAFWSRYSLYVERKSMMRKIAVLREHAETKRKERNDVTFKAVHEMSNGMNTMQAIAGFKLTPEKQAATERAINQFNAGKQMLVGKRVTSIIEAMRRIVGMK